MCPVFPDSAVGPFVRCIPCCDVKRGMPRPGLVSHGSSAGEGRQHFDHGTIVEQYRLPGGATNRSGVYQER